MEPSICELCKAEASVYCVSDSAYLCAACDSSVHCANFLVARHLRRGICSTCNGFDGSLVSGVGAHPHQSHCRSCDPEADTISSSSSTCVSTSKSSSDRPKISSSTSTTSGENPVSVNVVKAEAIFVNWCRKLGLRCDVAVAFHAFSVCLEKFTSLPLRVCFASSLWVSLKRDNVIVPGNAGRYLKKLEEISGVSMKVIVSVEKKICRSLKVDRKNEAELKEGWAEC